jgi:formate C-acetyltransferase
MVNVDVISKTIPVSSRVWKAAEFVDDFSDFKREVWGKRKTIINEETLNRSLIIRKALAENKVLSEAPVIIRQHELLVGSAVPGFPFASIPLPDYATKKELIAAAKRFTGVNSIFAHVVLSYVPYLTAGLYGLQKEAESKFTGLRQHGSDPEIQDWYESLIITLEGLKTFIGRHQFKAVEMAKVTTNQIRKKELEEIARVCKSLIERPPQTFREAIQAIWFAYVALQSTKNLSAMGRLDQNLWPYLKRDIENGVTTLEEAQELVDLLWIKCNEQLKLWKVIRTWEQDSRATTLNNNKNILFENEINSIGAGGTFLGGNTSSERMVFSDESAQQLLLSITLSGLNPEGIDSTNPLTYLCLNSTFRVKTPQPVLYVRFHGGSPSKLYERAADCIRAGCAGPTIFNDNVIIPALTRIGIPIKDAREYTSDGCFEVQIQGRTDFRHRFLSIAEVLERMLNPEKWEKSKAEGMYIKELDPYRNWQSPNPYTFSSFAEIMKVFKQLLDIQVRALIKSGESFRDGRLYKIAPQPLLSAFTDGTLESGKDITSGGAKYTLHMIEIAGLATVADSLAVIKKLCFEDKTLGLAELVDAVKNNWVNKEPLRQLVKTRVPAYGNDVDYVDHIAKEIVQSFVMSIRLNSTEVKKTKYTAGIATFENYAALGRLIGATPDGRLEGEPLSDNASPYIGRAINGQTAALNSFAKLPLGDLAGGSILNLAMSPVSGALPNLEAFIKSFMDKGGNALNINVQDVNKLRAAQKEPEKYRDLIVRVGGYDAYFIDLPRQHQELQIKKCEQYI